MEHSCRKCAPKASPKPLFNFWELTQNSHCMQEILLEILLFHSICPFESGKRGKEGKNYKHLNISRTRYVSLIFEGLVF